MTTRSRNGDQIRILVVMLLISALAACLLPAGRSLYEYEAARKEYRILDAELIREAAEPAGDQDTSAVPANGETEEVNEEEIWWPVLDIDFDAYRAINEDFVGILYYPQFGMRYPVVISQDNREYLTRTFEGEVNGSGCIFMDYQNNRRFTDRNTYLYGHNMKDGSMFGCLKRLVREPALCENDPKIYVYTPDFILEYQLYVVELAPADERLPNIYSDTRYDEYMDLITGRASFADTEIDVSGRPDMLTLYTCWGSDYQYKLLVHGLLSRKKELHPIILYPPKERTTYG